MDNMHLVAALLQLTGNLVPLAGSTPGQLLQLRQELAQVLQSQPLSEILPSTSADLQTIFSREPFITSDAITSIHEIASTVKPALQPAGSDVKFSGEKFRS